MITKEDLIEFGMTPCEDESLIVLKKVLAEADEEVDLDEMSICFARGFSTPLVLIMPDGCALNLDPENIEELKAVERCIIGWEPNY